MTNQPGQQLETLHNELERMFLQIYHSAEEHTVTDASLAVLGINNQMENQFNADDTERLLIFMLGHRSLANHQLGGAYNDYLPKTSDEELLRELEISYFAKVKAESVIFPEHKWQDVQPGFAAIHENAQEIGYWLASP